MCRLIDVDALKADYGMAEDCKDCQTGYRSCEYDRIYSKMDFCGWLDDAPPVDAVPVVRCRDCKHYEWTANRVPEEQTWWCYKHNAEMGNNDYCSYGERKDGDSHD